jgi:hypothetical protein
MTQTTLGALVVNDAMIHVFLSALPFGGVGAFGVRHLAYLFECGFVQGSLRLGKHSPHHRFEEL